MSTRSVMLVRNVAVVGACSAASRSGVSVPRARLMRSSPGDPATDGGAGAVAASGTGDVARAASGAGAAELCARTIAGTASPMARSMAQARMDLETLARRRRPGRPDVPLRSAFEQHLAGILDQ